MSRSTIEWCDRTWNPISGCTRLCRDETGKIYCYAYYMAQRLRGRYGYPEDVPFRPTFHSDKLLQPLKVKKPSRIFTGSMGDMFDPEVPDLWRDLVFRVIREAEQHTFLILTKRPELIPHFEYPWPRNVWLGTSVDGTTTDHDWDIEELFQVPSEGIKFVSFEPLLGPVEFDAELVDWIIIGAQTLPGGRTNQPKMAWVADIIREADSADVPVFLKDNLDWGVPGQKRQEWPKGVGKR